MIGMNVGDEEVMIFLINRYVMINGRYYRDMLPDHPQMGKGKKCC